MNSDKFDIYLLLMAIVTFLIGCVILYYIIKNAVKSAITEAIDLAGIKPTYSKTPDNSDEKNISSAQRELKTKFERSEISLEEYQKEWNKL